jgi:ribosome-binding ATPase YchF (GTP1/OBG family)
MPVELALAGTPSCGKSTFFKAATLKDVKIAPYPFTTTESTEGIAHAVIKCPCSEKKPCGKCVNGIRLVPFKLWDIPGLVADAHEGRGRGISFLDDIMQCQALIHIIDCSGKTDLEGNPSENFYPGDAVRMLETEFDWWLTGIFKRAISAAGKGSNEPFLKVMPKQFSGIRITESDLQAALDASGLDGRNYKRWSDKDLLAFFDMLRKTSKPTIIVANKIDVPGSERNFEKLKKDFPTGR